MNARIEKKSCQGGHDLRPREDCFANRSCNDPFPDPSLLDTLVNDQEKEVRSAVDNIINDKSNGLLEEHHDGLKAIEKSNLNVFRM